MEPKEIAKYLDFANHHANSTEKEIKELCRAVLKYGFHTAFVNPCYVKLAKNILKNKAAVGTVISFPLGQDVTEIKLQAALKAMEDGADELDICLNFGKFKQGDYKFVLNEMKTLVSAVKEKNPKVLVKFIIETGFLTEKEIGRASKLVVASGADFVKTCSGFGPRGAMIKDVKLIKKAIRNKAKVKAAGGIATYDQALAFINAGVDRIGTSHAIDIVKGAKSPKLKKGKLKGE